MANVPNAVEILPKIWTAWVGRTNVADDRQTDDRRTGDSKQRTLESDIVFQNASQHYVDVPPVFIQSVAPGVLLMATVGGVQDVTSSARQPITRRHGINSHCPIQLLQTTDLSALSDCDRRFVNNRRSNRTMIW